MQGGSRTAGGAAPTTPVGPGSGNTPGGQGLPLNIPAAGGHTQEGPAGGRQNLGQSPNMAAGPGGQHNSVNNQGSAPASGAHQIGPNLHHYRGLIPPFVSVFLDLGRYYAFSNMRICFSSFFFFLYTRNDENQHLIFMCSFRCIDQISLVDFLRNFHQILDPTIPDLDSIILWIDSRLLNVNV